MGLARGQHPPLCVRGCLSPGQASLPLEVPAEQGEQWFGGLI